MINLLCLLEILLFVYNVQPMVDDCCGKFLKPNSAKMLIVEDFPFVLFRFWGGSLVEGDKHKALYFNLLRLHNLNGMER